MDGNFAFLLPIVMAGFGGAFLLVWRIGAAPTAGAWAIASILDALAFATPAFSPLMSDGAVAIVGDALFALAFYFYAEALTIRFGLKRLRVLRLGLLVGSILAPAWAVLVADSLRAELIASDVTCSIELMVALARLAPWRLRPVDRALVLVSWFIVLDNLVRTSLVSFTAAGSDFETYLASGYAFMLQVTCTLSGFAFGLIALAAVTLDVIARYRRESQLDPLTGLLNRRGFDEGARAACANRPRGSVLTCDLDHFKHINDRFGHLVGDRVIAAFAELLRDRLPADAVVARFGGEEFVIYLPAVTVFEAGRVAEAIRGVVAAHDWGVAGIDGAPTASFGVADVTRDSGALDEALARADHGLYDAKLAGRDRVAVRLAA